jgi:hypothetical protein
MGTAKLSSRGEKEVFFPTAWVCIFLNYMKLFLHSFVLFADRNEK